MQGVEALLFTDNVVTECGLRKGYSKPKYVCALAELLWSVAMDRGIMLVVARVETASNPADIPSRNGVPERWMGQEVPWVWQDGVMAHFGR